MRARVLAVFAYDVSSDRSRRKLADLLEEEAARVQESVFEGWMSERRARALGRKALRLLTPEDRLRVYLISPHEAADTVVLGPGAPVEADDFHLF